MKHYFLVRPENQLVHLPSARIEEVEPGVYAASFEVPPPISPDTLYRSGARHKCQCLIVDEGATPYEVRVLSATMTEAGSMIVSGSAKRDSDEPSEVAKAGVKKELQALGL